jgi:hypothetical protein
VTTTAAGDLLIGWTEEDDNNGAYTLTYPTGWTALSGLPITDTNGWGSSYVAYQVAGAAGSYNWNPTLSITSPDGIDTIVAFKAATGGGANTWNKSLLDVQSAQDTHLTQTSRPVTGDSQSAVDAWTKQTAKPVADYQSALDGRTSQVARPVTGDHQSALDASVRQPTKLAADATSSSDLLGKSATKPTSDALSGLDMFTKQTQKPTTDSQSSQDSLAKESLKGFFEGQSGLDHFSQTDSLSTSNAVLSAQNWRKVVSDTFSETDLIASITLLKLLGDAYASQDTRFSQIGRPLYDGSSGTDRLTKTTLALLSDTGALSDLQLRQVQAVLVDVTSAVDKVTAGKVLLLTLLDSFSLLDTSMETYSKAQWGLLGLLTSLVASTLGMTLTFTNSTALLATTTLLANGLSMVFTIPF